MRSFSPEETINVLKSILDVDQTISGVDYLRSLAMNITETFHNKFIIIGHAVEPTKERIQTDVFMAEQSIRDNFVYELAGTPCENVLSGNRVCVYPNDVAGLFPEDKLLLDMGVESYIGAPMLSADGTLAGILALLDNKPIEDVDFYNAIVEFLAIRIGNELDRHYMEEELKRQVVIRTAELEEVNRKLQKSLSEIKTLQGIVPICSYCKQVRDDKGFWNQVEAYVTEHTEAKFSHGICPKCAEKHYPNISKK